MSEHKQPQIVAARREDLRWWIKLVLQPILLLAAGLLLLASLGVAQRLGYLTTQSSRSATAPLASTTPGTKYICPMMCVPPLDSPGRCPVCGMELVPANSGVNHNDPLAVHIAPATRRIANIQTVPASMADAMREVEAVGVISFNESTEKTIASYVGGRLDKLYADYTGMLVRQGDPLALIYSQELYSAQAELIEAVRGRSDGSIRSPLLQAVDLVGAASEKLRLLGLSDEKIAALKTQSNPSKHITIDAPMSGTVTAKLAAEGDYVRAGQPLLKVAELSTVWLMLELFPDDAGLARVGQQVSASVVSFPGEEFQGTVAFIAPVVSNATRTVAIRVLIDNQDGRLKIGDYADATMQVPLAGADADGKVLTVPRDAVLYAGDISVVYVETDPGRFEIRPVTLGPSLGRSVVVRVGLSEGDLVAQRGNFLIDSQMQLAGNPSLVDPRRLESTMAAVARDQSSKQNSLRPTEAEMAELMELPQSDRQAAIDQAVCPVTMLRLGSMGVPPKLEVDGQPVFICCESCRQRFLKSPDSYLAKLRDAKPAAAPADEPANAPELPPLGEIMEIIP